MEEGLGWYRRNFLVPVPEAGDLAALNELLLARCVDSQSHTISGRSTTMGAEMEQERPCLLPLAEESFELEETLFPVLARSPINCLIVEAGAGPIAEAARGAGRTVLETRSLAAAPLSKINWGAAGSRVVISDLSWPRMKLARRGGGDDSEAGPTGAPWIDSNSWVARLAAVRAPGKPIWLDFKPDPKEPPPAEAGYVTAIADAAAAGARWIVTLDEALAKGLAAGNAEASRSWGGIVSALAFFEARREWARWDPWGPVGVLSSFAGDDEYMGQEVLNLAARRNLLYRVLDRKVPDTHRVEGLRAVLYVDSQPPAPALKAKLSAFAESGGLLILPPEVGKLFPPGKPLPCAVAGYRQQAAGKGRVAVATQDWDDPYFLAADVHSLVSRKHDPVRLFNGRSLWMHYSIEPKRQAALLQLVSFTSRANQSVSLAPTRPWRTAAMHTIGTGEPRILNAVDVDGHPEFQLPPFSWYVALEFKS